jgi:hypothetical protein
MYDLVESCKEDSKAVRSSMHGKERDRRGDFLIFDGWKVSTSIRLMRILPSQ